MFVPAGNDVGMLRDDRMVIVVEEHVPWKARPMERSSVRITLYVHLFQIKTIRYFFEDPADYLADGRRGQMLQYGAGKSQVLFSQGFSIHGLKIHENQIDVGESP